MRYIAQKKEFSTAKVHLPAGRQGLLLEPVPIFLREEAEVRSLGGDAVYIARLMLNIDEEKIEVDYAKTPKAEAKSTLANNAILYPNPASTEVMIEFDNAIESNAIFEVYGYAGNLLQTQALSSGYQFISVSVKDLKAGIYYYRIISNNDIIAKDKLLIVK